MGRFWQLLRLISKGGEKMEQEIRLYSSYLHQVAYLYVKDRELAKDVVQQVWLKRLKKVDQFRAESQLKTYLVRMTVNVCHDLLRKQKKWYEPMTEKVDFRTPERRLLQKERTENLIGAIHTLTFKEREVIILHYFEEWTTPEIASCLSITSSAVRSRLQRARMHLKEKLEVAIDEEETRSGIEAYYANGTRD